MNTDFDDDDDDENDDDDDSEDGDEDNDHNDDDAKDLLPPAPQQPTYSWIMVMTREARSSWSHR